MLGLKVGTKQSFLPVIIVINVLLVVFIAGGWGYIAGKKELQEQPAEPVATPESETKEETEIWEVPLSEITEEPSPVATDPLKQFSIDFLKTDYKVMTAGKLVNEKISSGSKSFATLDLDEAVFYFKKGEIVRNKMVSEKKEQTLLIVDKNLYLLDDLQKTYLQINEEDEVLSENFFYPVFKYSCPLALLLEDNDKNLISWTKISENQWQAEWQNNPIRLFVLIPKCTSEGCVSEKKTIPIKITLDPETKFITKLALKFEEPAGWQEVTFKYQLIKDIEDFLTIPSDYKEEELEL